LASSAGSHAAFRVQGTASPRPSRARTRIRSRRPSSMGAAVPGSASWKRPVSIRAEDDPVAFEPGDQKLSAAAQVDQLLALEGSGARPVCPGPRGDRDASTETIRRPASAAWNCVGDDRQVGQFRARSGDCSRRNRCARLPRP
jgi:hypothetical protein